MDRFARASIILAFFACASCEKNAGENGGDLLTPLIGSWNWVLQYNNGIYSGNFTGNPIGDTLTPAGTGIMETLTFTADGKWTDLHNGQPFSQGTYKIDSLPTPAGLLPALDLVHPDGTDSFVNHLILHDTLIISNMEIITVGFNRVYVKQ